MKRVVIFIVIVVIVAVLCAAAAGLGALIGEFLFWLMQDVKRIFVMMALFIVGVCWHISGKLTNEP